MQSAPAVEHQLAQLLSKRRAARLASNGDANPAAAKKAGDPSEVRALAGPVDAFERNEASPHQRFPER